MATLLFTICTFSFISVLLLFNAFLLLLKRHVDKLLVLQVSLAAFISMLLSNWFGLSYFKSVSQNGTYFGVTEGFETLHSLILSWYEPLLFIGTAFTLVYIISIRTDVRVARILLSCALILELKILVFSIFL